MVELPHENVVQFWHGFGTVPQFLLYHAFVFKAILDLLSTRKAAAC